VDLVIILLLLAGVFFYFVGTIGLIRLPDVYSRLHATTKCDTLGVGLIFLSLILLNPISVNSVKLMIIVLFVWITNPTSAHIIARASYRTNMACCPETKRIDATEGDKP